MKKNLLFSLVVLFSALFTTHQSFAQCTSNTTAYWTHTASNTLNVTDALATCHYLTEYSTINGMNVGGLYEFTMTSGGGTGNAYITVMTGPGGTGTVVAHGVSPLTIVATAATLYPHWNVNAACATSTNCEVGTMTYLAPPSSCIQPVGLGASAITTTTALLNWTDANTTPAPNYDIYYALAFSPPPNSSTPATATSTTDTTTISALTPSTQYDYYVRGRCSATDTSAWSGPYTFTTLATCVAPSNLTATNVTSSGVDMGWTENNSATQWDIELGLQGFTPTGAATPGFGNITTNPYMLPAGLPPNTCFDFYVRSQCSPGDTSTWAGPFTFCTLAGGLSCPPGAGPGVIFYEGFDAATSTQTSAAVNVTPATGWTRNGSNATASMNWRLDNNAGNSGGTGALSGHTLSNPNPGYAMLETSSGPGFDTLFSPPVNLSSVSGAARTKFFYYMYGSDIGSLTFLVKHATGVDSLWSIAGQQHTNGSQPWDSVIIGLNAYVGQTIQLAWLGINTAGCCSGDINVDEVEVEACISCPAPSNIVASNIMATSCDLSWTENGSATLWDIEIVPSGTPPTGIPDSVGVTTNTNKSITGLVQYQAVDFYVRASCSATDSSLWTGPYTVLPCAPLAGAYTVDPALPASATNFQSLNAVAVALQCGITAPVVFNMAPSTTFNEQVEFVEVSGASATNTITFNGNGDTVTFATNAANWAVIRLDGSDYFRFNDIVMVSTSTATAIPLHMYLGNNSANHNMFTNCTFAVPVSSTSFQACPFGVSGSLTSPNATPANRADSNIIDSCTFIGGGSYALAMWGQGTVPYSSGNQVLNSDFVDFRNNGIYHAQQDNFVVSGCTFSQPTRTTFTATYPVYGDVNGNNNVYEKNRIHNIPSANANVFYGFFFFMDASSAANSNVIKNNLIDDINGSGNSAGIYLSNANNMQVYHNTIVFDNTASTTANWTRGIWQAGTAAPGQDFQNNNIYITRGGSGTNHGIWLDATAPTCDYNNCYVNGAGTNYFGENGGNQANLAAWQASTPTVGANSVSADPIFTQPAPDYSPANSTLNDVASTGLGVTMDYTGAARSVTPDIGAFEFVVPPTDISVSAILSPDTNVGCYTANDTVRVELTNSGSTVHDFAANPTTVTVQVTGTVTATLTATVNTGTLPVLGTLSVVLSPTVNMTANGPYAMNAYSNTTGDANLSNDTLATTYNYNVNLLAGTLTASPDEICASGTSDLTLTGNAGGFIQWQSSATGMAPWTNIGTGTNPHTTAVLTNTTYYRALLTCNSASDSTNVDTVVVNSPMITATTTDTVCGTDTVFLTASTTEPSIFWYDVQTGGTLLDTGANFSAVISATDTFWVAAATGATGSPVLITEVTQFTTGGYSNPGAPYPASLDDPIELTNVSPSPVDISGWRLEVTGGAATVINIPPGNVLPPGGTFVIDRGFTSVPNIPNVYMYHGAGNTSSGVANGYILSNTSGAIMDVTATNSFNVVNTGTPQATAADWTGTTGNSGGTGGIRRTAVDDTNDGADWTIVAAGTNPTNYGTINVPFTPTGCEGLRVPVVAVSVSAPAIMASNDTTVCWDSTVTVPLSVSSANTNYTYSWSPAYALSATTGTMVNASPLTPTQYVVTANDATTGCANTDTINVAIQQQFWDTASADMTQICGSGSVNLTVADSMPPMVYCASNATNQFDTKIDTVSFAGVSVGTSPTAQETYTDNTATVIPAAAGVALPLTVVNGSSSLFHYAAWLKVYIDYNQDGTFDPSEEVHSFGSTTALGSIPATTVTIPTTAYNGTTLMRVVLRESGTAATTQACGTYTYGETEDYTVDISGATMPPAGNTYTYSWMPGPLSGAMQTVSPTMTTTYFATQTDQFGCTATDSIVISVDTVPVVTATITPTTTCNNATATPMGGGAATYTWSGGLVDMQSFTVTPTTAGTYTVTGTDANGCSATSTASVASTPASNSIAQATAANASSTPGMQNQSQGHSDGDSVSYYDPSCNLIVVIDDGAGGNVLGNTMSMVTVDATVPTHNGEPFSARWYQITPTNNGPADVILYFTQADFDNYNAHPAVVSSLHDSLPTGPADAAGIARLRITKNDNGGLGVNPVELTPTSVVWNMTDNRWEVTIATPSFSQFRAHAANPLNTPLPVSLTSFTVTKQGSVSFATWLTESEQNNSHFNLQRSLDGNVFTTLGRVNTKAVNGNSSTELNYDFTDNAPQVGHNYYRLEQVDRDGNLSYSRVIDVVWGADGSLVSIYPNPATDRLNVDVSTDKVSQMEVRLLDMSGRVVKSVMQQTQKGMNNATLDLSDIASGVYGVQIYENNALIHTSKVNKQDK